MKYFLLSLFLCSSVYAISIDGISDSQVDGRETITLTDKLIAPSVDLTHGKLRSTAESIDIYANSSDKIFRGIKANAWSDGLVESYWFQICATYGSSLFTSAAGQPLTRCGVVAQKFQLLDTAFGSSVIPPTYPFEIVINSNRVSYTTTTGVTKVSQIITDTTWMDLIVPGMDLSTGSGAPALTDTGIGMGISGVGYDNTDSGFGVVQMPHGLALTNATRSILYVVPHVHWSMPVAPANNTNVQFRLIYEWANIDDGGFIVKGTNDVQVSKTQMTNSFLTSFGHVTNDIADISSIFRFKFARIPASAQEYGSRVIIDQIDMHVPIDRAGSSQETSQ